MFRSVFTRYASVTKYVLSDLTVIRNTEFRMTKSKPCLVSISATIFKIGVFSFSTDNHCKQKDKHVLEVIPIQTVPPDILAQTIKKRAQRRKKGIEDGAAKPGFWNVVAFATAEEYDLERLKEGLVEDDLYLPCKDDLLLAGGADVVHAVAKYKISPEPRHMYFFREGSVVLWNIPETECQNIIDFVQPYEVKSYDKVLVQEERESMPYTYIDSSKRSYLHDGSICVCIGIERDSKQVELDKYTFSNAMALTVKLGIWEASLDRYIESVEYVTEDLKSGKRLRITQGEVLCKTGELFALRHSINLSSDLLDIPDFYWDHDELEKLYIQTCSYFSISRRTRVLNEKLNHCIELVELLSTHLNDRHHVRLEWMIIILIMVEVGFEMLHFSEFIVGK